TAEMDVRLVDGQYFAVSARRDGYDGARVRGDVDSALNGVIIAGAVGGDIENMVVFGDLHCSGGRGRQGRKRDEAIAAGKWGRGRAAVVAYRHVRSGRSEVAALGTDLDGGVLGGNVFRRKTVDSDIIEAHADLMFRVDPQNGRVSRRHAADILQQDVAVDRNQIARKDGVHGVEDDGVGHAFHADVLVGDILD